LPWRGYIVSWLPKPSEGQSPPRDIAQLEAPTDRAADEADTDDRLRGKHQ